jgi:phage-related tail protein
MVQDITNEVELKTKERDMLLAGWGAFTSAKKIMQGGDDEKAMFDMTMEKLADDYGMKMGEIETFMDVSKGFIDGVDLENGIYEADALAQLEAWEKKSQNILGGPSDVDSAPAVRIANPALPAASANTFADLFEAPSDVKVSKRHL